MIGNTIDRHGFTSQEIVRNADGNFDIVVAPRARAGNWLPTGGVDSYMLVLRLYDTPVGVATRAAARRRCHRSCNHVREHHPREFAMIRWLLWLLAGALLGGIVHLVAVLILPRTATQDAYSRLPRSPGQRRDAASQPTPQDELMPFMDPAFATAVCRYDLASGPIKLTVPISPAYTSVSFYTRHGVAYYAINDRAAGRRQIELDLMTPEQRADLPEDEDVTAADRLIVESPTETGLILMRALAPEPGLLPVAQAALGRATCKPEPRCRSAEPGRSGASGA